MQRHYCVDCAPAHPRSLCVSRLRPLGRRLEQEQTATPGSFAANRALGSRTTGRAATLTRSSRFRPPRASGRSTARRRSTSAGRRAGRLRRGEACLRHISRGRAHESRPPTAGRTLAALTRRQLAEDAKRRSSRSARSAPSPARPPPSPYFHCASAAATVRCRPLERGFAELLTTDLSRSSKLTVVERARIQTLLDELALQQSGRTDADQRARRPTAPRRPRRARLRSSRSADPSCASTPRCSTSLPPRCAARHAARMRSSSCSTSRSASRSACSTSSASPSPSPSATRSSSDRRARSRRSSPTAAA